MKDPSYNPKKYKFVKYSKEYPKLYENEKKKITKLLGKNIIIEHVGSTSVPGLGGKGIIDIAILGNNKNWKKLRDLLIKKGYQYKEGHPGDHKRKFFEKIVKRGNLERRYHLHLCLSRDFLDSFIVFRNYLRVHDDKRDEYARIKRESVKKAKGDGGLYFKMKHGFLHGTVLKAFKENGKIPNFMKVKK